MEKTQPSFGDFLKARVGPNWVLARRTPRITRNYGQDVTCLSKKKFGALEAEYERETLRSAVDPNAPSKALTAAAPQLLDALDALADFYGHMSGRKSTDLADDAATPPALKEAWQKARAAIEAAHA